MKASLMIAIFLLGSFHMLAQDSAGQISMTVLDNKNVGLENATAALLRNNSKVLVQTALATKEGKISFNNLAAGTYRVRLSATGFQEKITDSIVITETISKVELPAVVLSLKSTTQLKEVTVSAKKPFIQRMNDRIIVNVDNSIVNAGSSAFEVLERSPGVTIDPNDNIALRGKQGVIIMIDGKPSPMTGQDLVNYLRGLPSNSIDRIEIITNPSSKYDAAGNSGIIDIRMKKDQRMGMNGTFTAGYGQGIYPKANTGLSMNYRDKKTNLFGSYNYAYRKNLNHLFLDRNFYDNGVFTGSDLKDNFTTAPFNSNTARFGADFFPSKKTIIGFVVNTNFNHFTRRTENETLVFNDQRIATSTFNTLATNNDNNKNFVSNINFKHVFDSTGRELTADVDYGVYNSHSLSTNATRYYKIDGSSQQPNYVLNGNQKGDLSLKTAKADYVHPLKKGTIEAGLKTSLVSADNDAKFFNASNGTSQNDVNKTNHFLYDENNNAAYMNYKRDFKKWDMQLGLRAEQTNIKTYQEIGKVTWDSSYLQVFPTAFFNYKLKGEQTIGVSVSRRINRPGYSQLNPFLFLIDVTTYSTGNPNLLPQFTWAYELNYTVKSINFTLGYSHTKNDQNVVLARFKDVFPNVPIQENNVTVQIPVNIGTSDYVGLTVSAPVKIKKWWNMINNADLYYNHFNGSLAGTKLDKGQPTIIARTTNTFTMKKGWSAELNGIFNSGGQNGFLEVDPQWGVGVGVQKNIWKNKGTLRFNMSDIFWTNLPKAVIRFDNYVEKWRAERDSRVANLSFTYRFGKNTVQAARKRATASEEERQRAGN